jgi:hypothetical protein
VILKNDNDHEDQWRAFIRRRLLIPWSSTVRHGSSTLPGAMLELVRLDIIAGTNMGMSRLRRKCPLYSSP